MEELGSPQDPGEAGAHAPFPCPIPARDSRRGSDGIRTRSGPPTVSEKRPWAARAPGSRHLSEGSVSISRGHAALCQAHGWPAGSGLVSDHPLAQHLRAVLSPRQSVGPVLSLAADTEQEPD